MTKSDHLSSDLLLRSIDDELTGAESTLVQSHLSQCEECRRECQELRLVSARMESLVSEVVVEHSNAARECLAARLKDDGQRPAVLPQSSEKVLRRFGWGMAIAATLAVGITLFPIRRVQKFNTPQITGSSAATAFEVDGESFVALPYSNPELPVSASHIVEMQVPVSSLMDAGILFEPVSNEVSASDGSVLADVLLGMDGQPVGVHVLGPQ